MRRRTFETIAPYSLFESFSSKNWDGNFKIIDIFDRKEGFFRGEVLYSFLGLLSIRGSPGKGEEGLGNYKAYHADIGEKRTTWGEGPS